MDTPTPTLRAQLTDGQANSVYRQAYHLSMRGDHKRATALLALLSNYRPQEPKYFHAGAVCCRKMGLIEDAVMLLARAMELSPGDDGLVFQHIECLMMLHRHEEAGERLQALAEAGRAAGNTPTVERAQALLQLMHAGSEPALEQQP